MCSVNEYIPSSGGHRRPMCRIHCRRSARPQTSDHLLDCGQLVVLPHIGGSRLKSANSPFQPTAGSRHLWFSLVSGSLVADWCGIRIRSEGTCAVAVFASRAAHFPFSFFIGHRDGVYLACAPAFMAHLRCHADTHTSTIHPLDILGT